MFVSSHAATLPRRPTTRAHVSPACVPCAGGGARKKKSLSEKSRRKNSKTPRRRLLKKFADHEKKRAFFVNAANRENRHDGSAESRVSDVVVRFKNLSENTQSANDLITRGRSTWKTSNLQDDSRRPGRHRRKYSARRPVRQSWLGRIAEDGNGTHWSSTKRKIVFIESKYFFYYAIEVTVQRKLLSDHR